MDDCARRCTDECFEARRQDSEEADLRTACWGSCGDLRADSRRACAERCARRKVAWYHRSLRTACRYDACGGFGRHRDSGLVEGEHCSTANEQCGYVPGALKTGSGCVEGLECMPLNDGDTVGRCMRPDRDVHGGQDPDAPAGPRSDASWALPFYRLPSLGGGGGRRTVEVCYGAPWTRVFGSAARDLEWGEEETCARLDV